MRELIQLSFPVVLTYLGFMSMGIVDILLVGRINVESIGAVGIGTSLFVWFLVFGLGLTAGLEYLISHAHGAKEVEKQTRYLVQGLLLSVASALPLTLIMIVISLHLEWFGIHSDVLGPAKKYTYILSFSLIWAYIFNVLRVFLTAMGIARPAAVMLLLGNILNAMMGYVLVLGHWGFPSMGPVGAAWATLTSRIFMSLGLGIVVWKWCQSQSKQISKVRFHYDPTIMKELLRIGMPSAFQMLFEAGVFALSTTLAARLSPYDLAAHQIVLNAASLTFMVPLGVGSATAILVGQALGRRDYPQAIRAGRRGFILGVGFMAFSCILLLCFSDAILGLFTNDPQVILVGKSILFIAALFQLSDGTQTVGTGALRGLGDTHGSMIFNFLGHWLIGLPIGVLLCFKWGWGIRGMWVGLSLGLTFVAVAVALRWKFRTIELK